MKKIDEEALAEAYNRALALEKAGDIDAAVKAYHQVLDIDPEDHGGAAVRIAAMGRGETPPRAPDAYVETLFDQHAESFEDILVEQLGYAVPVIVRQRLQEPEARTVQAHARSRLRHGAYGRHAARHGR